MRRICWGALAVALLVVTDLTHRSVRAAEAPPGQVGGQIADFTLADFRGARRSLSEWRDKRAVVVVFLGTECPLAKLYAKRLAELDAKYKGEVQFVGVNANQQDTLQELSVYATAHGVEFPLLKDAGACVADQFGARRTPEAYVLDQDRRVRYRGRIDDQYGVGSARKAATRSELAEAIDAILAGKPVPTPVTQAVGCVIGRRLAPPAADAAGSAAKAASEGKAVTFAEDIAPILNARCVNCHRAGQIAPFTLTDYADVVAWADTILEVIDAGRMPPWHASPEHGEFLNDARMPDEEKELFRQWVRAGTPLGDPSNLPSQPKFVDAWRLPESRVIYRMPEPYEVPATGTVDYQYFSFDPHFTEDKWVSGAEARPGNPAVVHHLFLFYLPPGQKEPKPADPLFRAIAAFAPGCPPLVGNDDHAVRIPAGSTLWFQVHYTPNGTPQTDRSEAALIFADPKRVRRQVFVAAGLNPKFVLPPLVRDYPIDASKTFQEETLLYTLTPHMHFRGKSFRFTAKYPDGTSEALLDVPRYDFNWQNVYILKKPKLLPAGTTVAMEGRFDNSPDNPLNPDPWQTVHWGDQTWDEMMLGSMTVARADEDLQTGGPAVEPIDDVGGSEATTRRVTFRYRRPADDPTTPPAISSVHVAGTFNDWNMTSDRLDGPDAEGWFTKTLVLPATRIEYKFILNGAQWKADPGASQRTREYGNSVLPP